MSYRFDEIGALFLQRRKELGLTQERAREAALTNPKFQK